MIAFALPLLQNNRNVRSDWSTVELIFPFLCPLTAMSISVLHLCTKLSYSACSKCVRGNFRICGTGSGKFRSSLVLRRQIVWRSVRRLSKRVFNFEAVGFVMNFRNVGAFSSMGTLRKETRDPRSSRLFCMGVPVRHQRCCAERLTTAWNWFVNRFRMSWAERYVSQSWHEKITLARLHSPSSKTILNHLILARVFSPRENSAATVAYVVNTIARSWSRFVSACLPWPRCLWKESPPAYVCLVRALDRGLQLHSAWRRTYLRISSTQLSIKTNAQLDIVQ